MILPTMNGESVDPAGQPALKTEERKVNKWCFHVLFCLSLTSKPERHVICPWCVTRSPQYVVVYPSLFNLVFILLEQTSRANGSSQGLLSLSLDCI